LIESPLLEISLTVIYLFEGKNGKEYAIEDNKGNRVFSFIDGKFPDG